MTNVHFTRRRFLQGSALGLAAARTSAPATVWNDADGREDGLFRIRVGGSEIGTESFRIIPSGDTIQSSSTVQFLMSAPARRRVELQTRLEMDIGYRPRSYRLEMEVDGRKGEILGTFPPGEAMFEFRGDSGIRKTGLLAGERFTLLDTNVFHHFIFLTRLYRFEATELAQRFQVIIPQEEDSGRIEIGPVGEERIEIAGKSIQVRHLRLDSGSVAIALWVDGNRTLRKISLPEKKVEVLRM